MALKFMCDDCGSEITDTLFFVRAPHRSSIIVELHEPCFVRVFKECYREWLAQFGLIEIGTQRLSVPDVAGERLPVRPSHRNGTVL